MAKLSIYILWDLIYIKYYIICYIYRCRCKGEIPHLHGGLQYLKYYIKIKKNSTFYMFPKQTEQINKKWLNVDAAMNGWLSLDTYIIVFILAFYIACIKTKYHLYIYIYIILCIVCNTFSIFKINNYQKSITPSLVLVPVTHLLVIDNI